MADVLVALFLYHVEWLDAFELPINLLRVD